MNEQNIPQSNEPIQGSKHIWIIIIVVVLTAITVGGGVYAWQKSSMQATEQSLQQQITDLQNQLTNLQKPTQPIVTTSEETQAPTQPVDETAAMNQKISTWCEKNIISGCLPITSSVLINSNDKYSVVKINDDANFLLSKKDNEWNVRIVSKENNICDTGSGNIDLFEYCTKKPEEYGSTESLAEQDETRKIVDKISLYCQKYNIPGCLPVSSYSIVDLGNKFAVVKIVNSNYLLTRKDSEWNVSIASQENNICETGSGNTDLIEYCKQ